MGLPEMISGRVWKLGDNVNTDILHPPSYFSLDEEKMKEGVWQGMKRSGLGLTEISSNNDWVIVAGENFGCGSSRETSVRGLRACGLKAVIAVSFARIFFRSLTNLCIPPLVCRETQDCVGNGDLIQIHLKQSVIELSNGRRFSFSPIDTHIERILEAGGLIPYLRREGNGV